VAKNRNSEYSLTVLIAAVIVIVVGLVNGLGDESRAEAKEVRRGRRSLTVQGETLASFPAGLAATGGGFSGSPKTEARCTSQGDRYLLPFGREEGS
jgi:hypothetical protein